MNDAYMPGEPRSNDLIGWFQVGIVDSISDGSWRFGSPLLALAMLAEVSIYDLGSMSLSGLRFRLPEALVRSSSIPLDVAALWLSSGSRDMRVAVEVSVTGDVEPSVLDQALESLRRVGGGPAVVEPDGLEAEPELKFSESDNGWHLESREGRSVRGRLLFEKWGLSQFAAFASLVCGHVPPAQNRGPVFMEARVASNSR
jgi:hypothetical protein